MQQIKQSPNPFSPISINNLVRTPARANVSVIYNMRQRPHAKNPLLKAKTKTQKQKTKGGLLLFMLKEFSNIQSTGQ